MRSGFRTPLLIQWQRCGSRRLISHEDVFYWVNCPIWYDDTKWHLWRVEVVSSRIHPTKLKVNIIMQSVAGLIPARMPPYPCWRIPLLASFTFLLLVGGYFFGIGVDFFGWRPRATGLLRLCLNKGTPLTEDRSSPTSHRDFRKKVKEKSLTGRYYIVEWYI